MARFPFPRYDSQHLRYLLVSAVLCGLIALGCGALFLYGPNQIPLWYSLVQPEEQLAPSWAVGSLAVVSLGTLLFGLWFGRRTDLEHERYLASTSWWAVSLLQTLLLIALLRIIKITL